MTGTGGVTSPDRGVSEVISVLLMVAVTIVLAAMVGSVLMNVVSGVDENPIAAATVDFDEGTDAISVTYTATQDPRIELNVSVYDASAGGTIVGEATLVEVGDRRTFENLTDGDRYVVQVVASRGDERVVVMERDGRV